MWWVTLFIRLLTVGNASTGFFPHSETGVGEEVLGFQQTRRRLPTLLTLDCNRLNKSRQNCVRINED